MNQKIKQLAVRITSKGLIGSGIIYWPEAKDNQCFVITAKHCILGDNFTNGAVATDVTIDKIYRDGIEWGSYKLVSSEELLFPADPLLDVAILKVSKLVINYDDRQLPTLKIIELGDERVPSFFKGYPFLKKHVEARTMDGILDGRDSADNYFHIKSSDNFTHHLKSFPINQLKGLSGSGVCTLIDDDIYLYGIVNQYESASHRFLGTSIGLIRKEFFPDTKNHDYEVEKVISSKWFSHQLDRSSNKLGPRFTWINNYPVAIQSEIDTFGRTANLKFEISSRFNKVENSYTNHQRWLKSNKRGMLMRYGNFIIDHKRFKLKKDISLNQAIQDVERYYIQLRKKYFEFDITGTSNMPRNWLATQVKNVKDACYAVINGLNDRALNFEPALSKKEADVFISEVGNLHQLIDETERFRNTNLGLAKLMNARSLLVEGPAGNGKSQLLAYTANDRARLGHPSILVLGQRLIKSGDPWAQILKDLELGCTKGTFLAALNRKAELSKKSAIFFVDALNEGQGMTLWPSNFQEFVSDFEHYPWIKLVMSYRSSFKRALFKDVSVAGIPRIEHLGFANRQREAMAFFFEVYNIAPVVNSVVMIDNFKNPLFLKLFCIAYASGSFKGEIDSSEGLFWIIDRFLALVNERLGAKDNFNFHSGRLNLVKKAVDAFVVRAINLGTKGINYEETFRLTETAVSEFLDRKGFVNGLIDEEVYYENAGGDSGEEIFIDFSYERFGDHMKVAYLLEGMNEGQIRDGFLKTGKFYPYFGTKILIEQNNGLWEAMLMQVKERTGKDVFDLAPTIPGFKGNKRFYILSLASADKKDITTELSSYVLEELLNDQQLLFDFWDNILPISFDDKLHFNADFLNGLLSNLTMAERDASWTFYLQHQPLFNQNGSVSGALLLSVGEYENLSPAQLFLLSITITWFLGSTNRKLRDHATKALITILSDKPGQLVRLLELFKDNNDPYISQRLYAVAYGCIVRTKGNTKQLAISKCVYEQIFTDEFVKPDLLLRDYARSIIEYTIFKTGTKEFDLLKIRPPYKSAAFDSFPTNIEIDKMVSSDHARWNETGEFGLSHILTSMVTEYGRGIARYGDFGRYVFGSAVSRWPEISDNDLSNFAVKMIIDRYGYNLQTHGKFDSGEYHRRSDGVDGKLERIGKKYQWIALFEILARLADNYRFESRNSEGTSPQYNGPWDPFVRDIDPTLLKPVMSPDQTTDWIGQTGWKFCSSALNEWLPDGGKKPDLTGFVEIIDESDTSWIVLQGATVWEESNQSEGDSVKEIWAQIRSYIVEDKEYKNLLPWAEKQNFMGRWMPESHSSYEVFNREFYWSPSANDIYKPDAFSSEIHERNSGHFVGVVNVTAAEYNWDTSNDNSRERNISMLKPSRQIMDMLDLHYAEIDGKLYNSSGKLIAYDPSFEYPMSSCLVIHKKALLDALKKKKLHIFWTILGERGNSVKYQNAQTDKRISFSGVISVVASDKLEYTLRKDTEQGTEEEI